MGDEGIELRARFGFEDARHGVGVRRVRCKAVNRLRGHGHEAARANDRRGFFDLFGDVHHFSLRLAHRIAISCSQG